MHIGLDHVLGAWAVVHTVITSLRAGSRAVYLLRVGKIGVMDGPLILEDSPLFDMTTLFRRCVQLGLQQHHATGTTGNNHRFFNSSSVEYQVHNVPVSDYAASSAPYSLSPFGNRRAPRQQHDANGVLSAEESMLLDEEIERILSEAETTSKQSLLYALRTRLSKGLAQAVVVPVSRTAVYTASVSQSAANWFWDLPRKWRRRDPNDVDHDESDDVLDEEALLYGGDDIESDFSVLLRTSVALESHEEAASDQRDEITAIPKPVPTRTATLSAIAPSCFADLRRFFGISEAAYQTAMLETGPYISFQSNSKGAARAGLWFFFTRDGAYMIKTIKKDEVKALEELLPKYYRFMQRFGRRSLLTRFCGMYQVTLNDEGTSDSNTCTFVVMNSVFPAEANILLTERYDLKGSTVGRECSTEEREAKGASAVLKDLDLQREVTLVKALPPSHGHRTATLSEPSFGLHIGPTAKAALLKQLRRDVQLLVACDAIDYSLLVGVAKEDFGLDATLSQAIDRSLQWEARLQGRRHRPRWKIFSAALIPVQALLAPPFYLVKQSLRIAKKVLIWPDPYYGSGVCAVDAGPLALVQGIRTGAPATYYFGLIDFLQPYNTKKAVEYRLKGLVYPRDSYSCVPPQLYADRFLEFLNEHIT